MRRSIRTSYTHTILASYLGYITQAVVNNFAPLLFLTFRSQMELTLEQNHAADHAELFYPAAGGLPFGQGGG